MIWRIGLAILLAATSAQAQELPPASDPRIDELIARQKRLEDQILSLQKATADPEAPAGRYPLFGPVSDAERQAPIAGYSNKNFFLRDRNDWFVFTPKGRVNVDWYNFLNRPHPPTGVEPNSALDQRAQLRDQVFIRRARVGIAGTIARVIDFRVEGEFANLAQPGQYATLADADVVINVWRWLKLQAGQFYSPFTLENQTSENFIDFLDKSTVVRWAVPGTRDTGGMLLGETKYNILRYWAGVFNGDGQNNKNLDNQPAVQWRAVFSPLGFLPKHAPWMEEVWFGGSFWWQRSDNLGGAGPPATSGVAPGDLGSLSTEGGFTVFSSNYSNGTDAMKNSIRSHLAPNGNTWKYAFELNVPVFNRFGLRSEYVHQSIDLREYNDLNPGNGNLVRNAGAFGHLDGWGAYVEAYVWLGGDVNVDRPGLYSIPHWQGYVPPRTPTWAIMLAAKFEHVEFDIDSAAFNSPAVGHYGLDTFALGANFWLTRHSRLMANYNLNYVGMGDPNLAAPNERKNLFFQKFEHELLFRLQVNL